MNTASLYCPKCGRLRGPTEVTPKWIAHIATCKGKVPQHARTEK